MDAESSGRLDELRRRAGSPSFQQQGEDDNLPSTSTFRNEKADGLLERHRKDKARQEKREKKAKERLDFEWPAETARKEARRAERRRGDGHEDEGRDRRRVLDEAGEDRGGDRAFDEAWMDNGHINLFADVEKEVCSSLGVCS